MSRRSQTVAALTSGSSTVWGQSSSMGESREASRGERVVRRILWRGTGPSLQRSSRSVSWPARSSRLWEAHCLEK